MYRRSVVSALLGTGLLGSLAGCNGLFGDDANPSSSTSTAGPSPTPSAAASATATATEQEPYRAPDSSPLETPRGVRLRNLGSTQRFATVVVTAPDGTELLATSTAILPGQTASFPNLLGSVGTYDVLVETADGRRRRYDWTVAERLDDLWVDLLPDIAFHRPVLCFADSPFARADIDQVVGYGVSPALDVGAALGSSPALAIDSHETAETRATLKLWHQGQLRFASSFAFPPDVRALVPVFPATYRYDVLLRTDAGAAIYDWQPSVRNTLYASVVDEPSFRCGDAAHDLRVRNETGEERSVTVRVLTGERTLFEQTVAVDPGETATETAAVDPAGPFKFEVSTGDLSERYNWVRCAPNGPITVAVSDRGIYVSIQPIQQS